MRETDKRTEAVKIMLEETNVALEAAVREAKDSVEATERLKGELLEGAALKEEEMKMMASVILTLTLTLTLIGGDEDDGERDT